MLRLRVPLMIVLAMAILAVPVASAGANSYADVLRVYERSGSIPPCRFSSAQLASALKQTDPYGAQYFADFTNAIQQALAARGSGRCVPGGGLGLGAPATSRAGAAPGDSSPGPQSSTAPTSSGLPAAIAIMGLAAAAFALIAATVALGSRRAWDPAWAAGWRHAWREAGYRFGGRWAEFVDWLRSA